MIHWSCARIHDTLQALELSFSDSVNQNSSEAKPHFCSQLSIFPWNEVSMVPSAMLLCAPWGGWGGWQRSVVRTAKVHTEVKDVYDEGQANWPPHNPGEPVQSDALQGRRAGLPRARSTHRLMLHPASRRHHRTRGWHTRWDEEGDGDGRAMQSDLFPN